MSETERGKERERERVSETDREREGAKERGREGGRKGVCLGSDWLPGACSCPVSLLWNKPVLATLTEREIDVC